MDPLEADSDGNHDVDHDADHDADDAAVSLCGTTSVRVRYGETDQMGVVYHGNYLAYFELGRTELIRQFGLSYAELERRGVRLPVVDVSVRYTSPARYDDEILIHTELTESSPARMRFDYELRHSDDDRLLARGHSVLASVDEKGRPRRLPPELRFKVRRRRDPEPPETAT